MRVPAFLALAAAPFVLCKPSFNISGNQFILDGAPYTIKSGSLHYFRVLPELWVDRLQRMAAMGLNTVQTYIAWNWHRLDDGSLDFATPSRNISAFFETAQSLNMNVLLRPGPFICGEWEMGGLPSEMYLETPGLVFRTNNSDYLAQVGRSFGYALCSDYARSYCALYTGGFVLVRTPADCTPLPPQQRRARAHGPDRERVWVLRRRVYVAV